MLSQRRGKLAHCSPLVQDDFTRQPLGEDEEERQYWLHDLRPGGLRLCREILPTEDDAEEYLARAIAAAAKAKGGRTSGGKKGGRKSGSGCLPMEDLGPGPWETIATTLEDIDEVRSTHATQHTPRHALPRG